MNYKIIYHPLVASEDLPRIPHNLRIRIKKAIETRLLFDPISAGAPLRTSLKGHRKLRVGDYRIIYRLEKDTIIVLKIGHRKDVYLKVFTRIGQ